MVEYLNYRQHVGWFPSGNHLLWASLGGLLASVVIGFPMMQMGALSNMVAALVGMQGSLLAGWIVHLVAGAVFGGALGLFVQTHGIWKGIGYGLVWGALVGVLFAWLAVFLILGLPIDPTMPAARNDLALHVLWGAIVGGVYALGLRRTEAVPPDRRPAGSRTA